MKKIPLTQGLFALVDDEDFDWLNQWKWYAQKSANTFYAVRNSKRVNGKREQIRMHVEILGKKEGFMADHLNGAGLDNQRYNLRHVTRRQNAQNRHHDRSSKYPGVSWRKDERKWESRIWVGTKRKRLGLFTNEAEAAQAYQKALLTI